MRERFVLACCARLSVVFGTSKGHDMHIVSALRTDTHVHIHMNIYLIICVRKQIIEFLRFENQGPGANANDVECMGAVDSRFIASMDEL